MNRADALAYMQGRYDALMLGAGRTVDDSPTGYAPALDAAFMQYIVLNGLSTTVMDTVIAPADVPCFTTLLEATMYDVVLPAYALQPDVSVDAPLTNVKFSQMYRQLGDLRTQAWTNATACGYVAPSAVNADGFVLTLTHNEPSGSAWREFG